MRRILAGFATGIGVAGSGVAWSASAGCITLRAGDQAYFQGVLCTTNGPTHAVACALANRYAYTVAVSRRQVAVLDKNGKAVFYAVIGEGVGTSVSEGVHVLANGDTVTNCVVRGFLTGVFSAAQGTRVVADTLSQNNEGLRLQGATGASVLGNTANANAWWGILACCNANGNTISGNTAELNRGVGMTLNGASSNRFTNNVSTHNDSGFGIGFSSDFNTISHNIATNNTMTGFDFLDANDNTIDHNVSVHNGSCPNGGGYAFQQLVAEHSDR